MMRDEFAESSIVLEHGILNLEMRPQSLLQLRAGVVGREPRCCLLTLEEAVTRRFRPYMCRTIAIREIEW